jgi:superfamily I DNA/RNA helicase
MGETRRHARQPDFVIPPARTLQRLAEPAVAAEARRCLVRLGEDPTAAQWEMILAPTASTCVIAGAGSGKSTTLILRLLVLHKVLAVPLEEMHVFSFTRASTREFQRRLALMLARWEEVIEGRGVSEQRRAVLRAAAVRTVSTFHSVLAGLSRDVLPGGEGARRYFDLLEHAPADEEALSGFNPFVTPTLSDAQARLLQAAHAHAFEHSARYRELLQQLALEQERQYWRRAASAPSQDERLEQWKWDQLMRQERAYHGFSEDGRYAPPSGYQDRRRFQYVDPLRAALADRLLEWDIPFRPLAAFSIDCPIPGGFPGQLYASFQIGERLYVHVERFRSPVPSRQGPERALAFHERVRRRFITLYSLAPDQHRILAPEDFDTTGPHPATLTPHADFKLQQWLTLSGYAAPGLHAPAMLVQLQGERRRVHIAELLYQEGLYVESLGLEVERLPTPPQFPDASLAAVAEALPLFWREFRQLLAREHLLRFHDILSGLRDEHTLRRLLDKLGHLRHLFVDEFQDGSPEIVDWLAKTLRVLAERAGEVSVTAIGDDYQSIYGWRGSHPAFLMHFERYFPAASVGRIVLPDNFRSRQQIIDAAEALLAPVRQKIPKHGISALPSSLWEREVSAEPVYLVEAPLAWGSPSPQSNLWRVFCAYAVRLLAELEATGQLAPLVGQRQALSVFVLARTNLTKGFIPDESRLGSSLLQALREGGVGRFRRVGVRRGTFHHAKGLEADIVLLLDDSQPPDEAQPLREHHFSLAAPPDPAGGVTYRQAMSDEALRLAYVALTRARLGLMWAPLAGQRRGSEEEDAPPAAANGAGQASTAAQGAFTLLKRSLQAEAS